jgi:RNase P/RNase MRP subunit POP5
LLKRRHKRRYIAVRCDRISSDAAGKRFHNSGFAFELTQRIAEMYGFIVAYKSSVRDIGHNGNAIYIIRCNLIFLETVLSTIPLMDPPALVLCISGTIKRLRIKFQKLQESNSKEGKWVASRT